MEMDIALYDKCARENNEKIRQREQEREAAAAKWQSLMAAAAAAGVNVTGL
jgi:hypothetical protein